MSKIIFTLSYVNENTELKEKYDVSDPETARELFNFSLNKCLRMMAEGNRDLKSKQQEIKFETLESEESVENICQDCVIGCNAENWQGCGDLIKKNENRIIEDPEIAKEILDLRKKIEELHEKSTIDFATELYTTEIKARKVFIPTLNEDLRGMEETIELIFDAECQAYLYDEKFLQNVIMKKYDDELEGYIAELQRIKKEKHEQLRRKLSESAEESAEAEAVTESAEIKPAKKRSKKQQ